MSAPHQKPRVLAVDPAHRGFGYAVLEEASRLVDWGVAQSRTEIESACLARFSDLVRTYRPDVLVLEDMDARACQRHPHVRGLVRSMAATARAERVRVRRLTWRTVRHHLSCADAPRYPLALQLARRFPEIAERLPRPRKPWMSEDPRLRMFNAVALALACVSPSRAKEEIPTLQHHVS